MLQAEGIQTGLHYPIPVHLQEAHADLGHKAGDFPQSEAAANEVLSLPMFPEMTPTQVEQVAAAVRQEAQCRLTRGSSRIVSRRSRPSGDPSGSGFRDRSGGVAEVGVRTRRAWSSCTRGSPPATARST